MFHRHKWVEIERFHAEPVVKLKVGTCLEPFEFQKLVMGVTTILYECRRCGKQRRREILGKSTKEQP